MAKIFQPPCERHWSFILRQATWLAEMAGATVEERLAQQLEAQGETVGRHGIAADLSPGVKERFEAAVRGAIFQIVPTLAGTA